MHNEPGPVVDRLPGLAWTAAADGRVDSVNRPWCAYTGLPAGAAQGDGWQSVVHPDDLPALLERWAAILRSGQAQDMQARLRRFDGAYRRFLLRVERLDAAAGTWCGLAIDIEDLGPGPATTSTPALDALIDSIPGFVWRTAPDGSVEFLNQRWFDYTGMTPDEARGTGWMNAVHPSDAPALGEYWQGLLAAGLAGEFEARLRRFDGSYRWFLIHAVPQRDEAGRVLKWYGGNTDIDARKRAELLLAGEKRLHSLMAGGAALPLVLEALCQLVEASLDDCLCGITLVAPRRSRRAVQAPGELRLQPGAGPGLPPGLMASDGQAVDAGNSPESLVVLGGETVVVADLSAETRWPAWCATALAHGLRASWATPVIATGGEVSGVLSLFFHHAWQPDEAQRNRIAQFSQLASIAIERARGEAALKQSEAFLAKAQRISLTGTFSWHVDNDEIAWSDEIYRLLDLDPGLTPSFELVYSRVHPDDLSRLDEVFQRQRHAARDFEHEHRLLLPGGVIRHVHIVAQAMRDADGALEYIAAVQDVTQRRLADEALGRVRAELAHVARVASLGALTASIAHEVNQPLAGIITNANTCLRMLGATPPNVDGARETARRTIRDGNRAADVIKRLRALFAKDGVASEPVDLNAAAREVLAMLQNELQRNGVAVLPQFNEQLPPVPGDRVQLQQVILNLIINAMDALAEVHGRPRQLRISSGYDLDSSVFLAVRDNGNGFPPQDAHRLFDAFYTTKRAGMGIGLLVSRSIIEHHAGRIWATAHDGPGATFIFSIPLPAADADDDHARGNAR